MKRTILSASAIALAFLLLWMIPHLVDEPTKGVPQSAPSLTIVTRAQLLEATDIVEQAAMALDKDNAAMFTATMNRVIDAALQLELPASDLDYLQSSAARDYLTFLANRKRFDDGVVEAFLTLQSIDMLKTQFPQARDKFEQADSLIAHRDEIYHSLIQLLQEQGDPAPEVTAAELWRQRFNRDSVNDLLRQQSG